jgi:hypothetical protein
VLSFRDLSFIANAYAKMGRREGSLFTVLAEFGVGPLKKQAEILRKGRNDLSRSTSNNTTNAPLISLRDQARCVNAFARLGLLHEELFTQVAENLMLEMEVYNLRRKIIDQNVNQSMKQLEKNQSISSLSGTLNPTVVALIVNAFAKLEFLPRSTLPRSRGKFQPQPISNPSFLSSFFDHVFCVAVAEKNVSKDDSVHRESVATDKAIHLSTGLSSADLAGLLNAAEPLVQIAVRTHARSIETENSDSSIHASGGGDDRGSDNADPLARGNQKTIPALPDILWRMHSLRIGVLNRLRSDEFFLTDPRDITFLAQALFGETYLRDTVELLEGTISGADSTVTAEDVTNVNDLLREEIVAAARRCASQFSAKHLKIVLGTVLRKKKHKVINT